jgi:hypothetical protein
MSANTRGKDITQRVRSKETATAKTAKAAGKKAANKRKDAAGHQALFNPAPAVANARGGPDGALGLDRDVADGAGAGGQRCGDAAGEQQVPRDGVAREYNPADVGGPNGDEADEDDEDDDIENADQELEDADAGDGVMALFLEAVYARLQHEVLLKKTAEVHPVPEQDKWLVKLLKVRFWPHLFHVISPWTNRTARVRRRTAGGCAPVTPSLPAASSRSCSERSPTTATSEFGCPTGSSRARILNTG